MDFGGDILCPQRTHLKKKLSFKDLCSGDPIK